MIRAALWWLAVATGAFLITLPFWYRWKWRNFSGWWEAEGMPIFVVAFFLVAGLFLRWGFWR
jgi:hypothetical protein